MLCTSRKRGQLVSLLALCALSGRLVQVQFVWSSSSQIEENEPDGQAEGPKLRSLTSQQSDGHETNSWPQITSSSSQLLAGSRATAAPQQIELGEGLSLSDRHNSNNNNHEDGHSADLPLAQLERIKSEASVSAVAGQNVVLNCAVQFKDGQEKPFVVQWLKWPNKLPIYIWYAGYPAHVAQGYERRVARIGQASLNLSSVKESDQGLYECKITYLEQNTKDKANGTWIFLDVQAPPHFTQTPPAVSYVQAGDSLHLTCQAQSTPAPILRWYKNKVPIDSDAGPYRLSSSATQQSSDTPQHSSSNSSQVKHAAASLSGQSLAQLDLFIDNVQAGSTTGDYVCLASNSEGSVEARSQVALAVPAIITTWPRNQTRLEGESAEFLCQARALPANVSYKWLFNDRPISQVKRFESRFRQKLDGTLELHSLQRDDEGEFKCRATNGLSHRERLAAATSGGSSMNRAGKSRPPPPIYAEAAAHLRVEFPARVTYSPPIQFLPLNMPGQIRCFVAAAPPVEFFTWTLNNQQFDPNADPNIERLANGSLLVRQVSKHYEGAYRCTPFNKHGSAGSSAAMEVRVEEPPAFTLRPADFYKANLNGEVRLPCDAKGSPQPQVSWRRVVIKTRDVSSGSMSKETSGEQTLDRRRRHLGARAAGSSARTTRKFTHNNNNNQAHLTYDEANDEPDENHHFYATTGSTTAGAESPLNEQEDSATPPNGQQQQQKPAPISPAKSGSASASDKLAPTSAGQQQEQQTVISYEKVPQGRAELKNGQLVLRNLRKEDHGRYECVVENEVATLVAPTMLYIEETTPHAPSDLRVETKSWSAQVSWTAGYDGGFEQSFVVWYRQVERPREPPSESALPSPSELATAASQQQELIDVNWHSISVQPSDSTSLTVHNLSQDTSYEFYVRAKNIIGEGPRSRIVQATTKRAVSGSVTPISGLGPDYAASTVLNEAANQTPADYSTAPKNVSMMKVAQGWVLSWSAPTRLPSAAEPGEERAEAMQQQRQHSNSSSLIMLQADEQQLQQAELNGVNLAAGELNQQQQNKFDPTTLAYSIELKEKQSSNWLTLSTSREQSLLLKDLKPGTEYQFRVVAHAPGGLKGTPSPEFRYVVPDNRRKPGLSQAFSATVTSGLLFFIACIVIAVCGVNMCNKRRKKRAEKAAYVMMACPVLESHHDLAALNSNSLLKNGAANAAQDRVSGVSGHLARNLRLAGQQGGGRAAAKLLALGGSLKTMLTSRAANNPADSSPPTSTTQANNPHSHSHLQAEWALQREINFSSNAPVPVDVGPGDQLQTVTPKDSPATPGEDQPRHLSAGHPPAQPPTLSNARPIDDYWIRQPSDRKWGTLTLAASKLAERRANSRREQTTGAARTNQESAGLLTTVASVRTLPRSFKSAQLLSKGAPSETNQISGRNGASAHTGSPPPPPLPPPHAPKVAPRATRSGAPLRRPQVEPPAPPERPRNANEREQVSEGGVSFAAAAAAQHRRSISHIEARRALQRQERSMLAQQQQSGACQWLPANNWTQQDLSDFASMSFGPPAQAALGGLDWSFAWPNANDSLDAVRLPAAWPPFGQQPFDHFQTSRQQLGARNSLARSTLPLMAPPQANFNPSVLAPPYNFAHDLNQQQQQPQPNAPANRWQQKMSLCPFYPHFLLPPEQRLNYGQQQAQQMAPMGQDHQASGIRDNDDPLTENACLGSYRRKRRLPHIEAQFTMVKAPELPAENSKANQLAGDQLEVADAFTMQSHSRPTQSESLRWGQLYVCDAPAPAPTPAKPPGLPQPGQRTEQRRLRQASPAELNVERIDARDKVELYLRHHQVAAKRAPPPPPLPESSPQFRPPPPPPLGDSSSSSSSVELSQVNELTFQPYCNLPSLKYTISLPLKSGLDGCLTLKKSASLKPVKSARLRRSRRNSEMAPGGDRKWQASWPEDQERQLNALELDPPPVPQHRAPLEQQQQPRVQVGPTSSNESQRTQTSANLSGSSPSSSVVSSGSCSAASDETTNTANTDTGIERSRSSATQASGRPGKTRDHLHDDLHSADENYEFDQVSSCSSSRVRRRVKRLSRSAGRLIESKEIAGVPERVLAKAAAAAGQQPKRQPEVSNEAIYSKVNKRRARKRGRQAGGEAAVNSLERVEFYDYARLKEQELTRESVRLDAGARDEGSTGELTLTNENVAQLYDTVYESFERR